MLFGDLAVSHGPQVQCWEAAVWCPRVGRLMCLTGKSRVLPKLHSHLGYYAVDCEFSVNELNIYGIYKYTNPKKKKSWRLIKC